MHSKNPEFRYFYAWEKEGITYSNAGCREITDSKIIIFGAGKGLLRISPAIIRNVSYIVDNDHKKEGCIQHLYGKSLKIVGVDELACENVAEIFVIISCISIQYIREIEVLLFQIFDSDRLLFSIGDERVFVWYRDIYTLFLFEDSIGMLRLEMNG